MSNELTKKQIEFLNRYTKGTWTYDAATGVVDVDGNFICCGRRLKTLCGIKFGKVSGAFVCSENKLTSLQGAPREVGSDFICFRNKLTSLEGAPQEVGWGFFCFHNELTSLKGAPQKVGGHFICEHNKLTSLEGAPQEIGGWFTCDEFHVKEGFWNAEKAQKLILTFLSPEVFIIDSKSYY